MPTQFLHEMPATVVVFEFEDLRQFAAEYHPEGHRMVLNLSIPRRLLLRGCVSPKHSSGLSVATVIRLEKIFRRRYGRFGRVPGHAEQGESFGQD